MRNMPFNAIAVAAVCLFVAALLAGCQAAPRNATADAIEQAAGSVRAARADVVDALEINARMQRDLESLRKEMAK